MGPTTNPLNLSNAERRRTWKFTKIGFNNFTNNVGFCDVTLGSRTEPLKNYDFNETETFFEGIEEC